jgi:hypothetical protein
MNLPAPIQILAGLVAVFGLVNLARWALAVHSLRGDAADEYATRQRNKPATITGVSQTDFVRLYVASFQPRWTLYAAGAAAAVLVVSPAALILTPMAYEQIWQMNGAPEWGNRTGYVFMFSLMFALCFIWALVAAAFARLYHQRTPEPFHHALARARGEPIPEETAWRRRPKWARKVRPNPSSDASSD